MAVRVIKIFNGLGLGLKVNHFSELYDSPSYSAEGYGIGFGFLFSPVNRIRIGALVENLLSTDYKSSNETIDKIYPNVLLGASFQSNPNSLLLAGELNVNNSANNPEIKSISLGSELAYFNNFKFRAGYLSSKDTDYKATGSLGFGLNLIDNLRFDYAIQHTGEQKSFSHHFALTGKI